MHLYTCINVYLYLVIQKFLNKLPGDPRYDILIVNYSIAIRNQFIKHLCVCIYIYIYMYICICICICTIYIYIYVYIYLQYIYMYNIYIYIYMYNIHIYIYTKTFDYKTYENKLKTVNFTLANAGLPVLGASYEYIVTSYICMYIYICIYIHTYICMYNIHICIYTKTFDHKIYENKLKTVNFTLANAGLPHLGAPYEYIYMYIYLYINRHIDINVYICICMYV
jgi:hypothetical protein